jgi:hypothetical protein
LQKQIESCFDQIAATKAGREPDVQGEFIGLAEGGSPQRTGSAWELEHVRQTADGPTSHYLARKTCRGHRGTPPEEGLKQAHRPPKHQSDTPGRCFFYVRVWAEPVVEWLPARIALRFPRREDPLLKRKSCLLVDKIESNLGRAEIFAWLMYRALTLLITWEVFSRYALDHPHSWAFDVDDHDVRHADHDGGRVHAGKTATCAATCCTVLSSRDAGDDRPHLYLVFFIPACSL